MITIPLNRYMLSVYGDAPAP